MGDGFKSFYQDLLEKELVDVLPPELLERYEVTSCLVHGKNSEIYLVSRRKDGVLGILRVGKADAWENAQAEFDILRRLDHPGIPKAMDVFSWEGKGFLVREYMQGQTLDKYVKAFGPLKQSETIDIGVQICDILTVLHGMAPPIIHRDIKPENIIIDKDGKPKLIDFGIARIYRDKATSDTIAIGTRSYMAPEQFGASQTDARADIYSLGVVLIFLGTQSPERANLRQRYPHKALLPIILKCTKYDPDKRYGKSTQLKRALLGVQRSQRRRALLAVGAGVAALGAAGAGIYLAHQSGYESGVTDGLSQAMQLGFTQGYTQGETTGYEKGRAEGYDAGYREALEQTGLSNVGAADEGDSSENSFAQEEQVSRGNTNGNYANGGLAVTDGTRIYYSGGDEIQQMDMQGKNARFFCAQPGENLSLYGDYLYFRNTSGVWRAGLADGTVSLLRGGNFNWMMLMDETIYVTDKDNSLWLYRMDLEGRGLTRVSDKKGALYLNLESKWMVFADEQNENRLTVLHMDNGVSAILDSHNTHWINVVDKTVFYSQFKDGTGLYRIPLGGGERTKIASISASFTNVTSRGIFFANGHDGSKLYWISLDGGEAIRLTDAHVSDINVVGDWVFFRNQNASGKLFCIEVGEDDLEGGTEAKPAAVQVDL